MAEQEQEERGDTAAAVSASATSLLDLPEAVALHIFSLVSDVRSRNSLSLVSLRCRNLERSTRTSFCVRGNVRDLFLLPASFSSVVSLDLSLLSPWGHPFPDHHLLSLHIRSSFPNVASISLYARGPHAVSSLAPCWGPSLRHASLVRWHQRPPHLHPGADLLPLLSSCPNLSSLDLSRFYFWTEDLPAALLASPSPSLSLTSLDLLNPALPDGFRSDELLSLASACPNLTRLRAPCSFHPRSFHPLSDHSLLLLASSCPRLSHLHLADPASFHPFKNHHDLHLQSNITPSGLAALFSALPSLEHFSLDLCHRLPDSSPALELLANKCPNIKTLRLGHLAGICTAAGLHLDGLALCGGLRSLCVKDSPDLTDAGLARIARGCRLLSTLEIHGCPLVTSAGIARMAGMLRNTLVDVTLSRCARIDAAASIRAVEPIRDRIERLHVDCVWTEQDPRCPDVVEEDVGDGSDLDEENGFCCSENPRSKKCRYAADADESNGGGMEGFWYRTWDRLRYLSLWIPAGVQLSPLPGAGLEECPELEEISIKIEGDCRARPTELVFGLVCLTLYPKLTKMKLDCGDATGYALTAPNGQMDLSLWERFYLTGIGSLSLYELDYWPPQDKDVNQRSLSLPAAGLIQECATLRKLFIHGTTHEHFMRFFLRMPNLRDVQLREDYYPAPENDMSTEMRVDSCSRFEDALNSRPIPD